MRYFILAGEASGDLHASDLVAEILKIDRAAEICGWGGDQMAAAGATILKHYRELAFMGFAEVLRHLPAILRNFREAKAQIRAFKPDVLILVDYPGFNLRMARWSHGQGIPVHYYISPQLWAWKESRVRQVRRWVDRMYVILPFERPFYARHGITVQFVGHPLAWRIAGYRQTHETQVECDRTVLLPGSRRREILDILPVMLEAATRAGAEKIWIAAAPAIPATLYHKVISDSRITGVVVTYAYTYELLLRASAALCTSGTATLEAALFDVPQVVCYRADRLSYLLARMLVRIPFIALVNLIGEKQIVTELIQDNLTADRAAKELQSLSDPQRRSEIISDYAIVRSRLDDGNPAERVARAIVEALNS